MQQIAISGVGGQGILFITKLLGETALDLGYAVLISETHGMAQRGGNVISHLKVAERELPAEATATASRSRSWEASPCFAQRCAPASAPRLRSPLIRPGCADILLAIHPDGLMSHGYYLKPDGRVFCNRPESSDRNSLDADRIATDLGAPVCANLVLLGFALGSGVFFCRPQHVEQALRQAGGKRLEINLNAFQVGLEKAGH